MPDAVEAAYDGGFRGHERIGHPDREDGVLLAHRLSCSDLAEFTASGMSLRTGIRSPWPVSASDEASGSKLQSTAEQRNESHHQQERHRHVTCSNGLCGNRDRKSQCDRPDIERKIRIFQDLSVEPWEKISDKPCEKTRSDQKREDLGNDDAERRPEIHSMLRMDHRHHERHKDSCQQIYKHDVGGYARNISSQLARDDCRGGCRRTDQTEHGTLDQHHLVMICSRKSLHSPYCKQSECSKEASLSQQKPPMPPVWL